MVISKLADMRVDYIDYYDMLYCPELGAMCDTNLDCIDCLYRERGDKER